MADKSPDAKPDVSEVASDSDAAHAAQPPALVVEPTPESSAPASSDEPRVSEEPAYQTHLQELVSSTDPLPDSVQDLVTELRQVQDRLLQARGRIAQAQATIDGEQASMMRLQGQIALLGELIYRQEHPKDAAK